MRENNFASKILNRLLNVLVTDASGTSKMMRVHIVVIPYQLYSLVSGYSTGENKWGDKKEEKCIWLQLSMIAVNF